MTDAITETSAAAPDRMRVWDAPLRVFHWGLVAAFTLAWLTADEWQTAHEIAGYAVAGLVAFRLVWGFAGNRHARFARFLRGPVATLDYLRDMLARRERRYLGHNPAGAAMTLALLVTLSATAFTGWQIAEPARPALRPDPPQVLAPADETRPARRGDRHPAALPGQRGAVRTARLRHRRPGLDLPRRRRRAGGVRRERGAHLGGERARLPGRGHLRRLQRPGPLRRLRARRLPRRRRRARRSR